MLQAYIDEAARTLAEITSASPRELYLATAVLAAAAELMYLAEKPDRDESKALHGPAFIQQTIKPSSVRFELVRWLTPTSWYDIDAVPYPGRTPLEPQQFLRAMGKYRSRTVFLPEEAPPARVIPLRRRSL